MTRRSARALVLLCVTWLLSACASQPVPTAAQVAASNAALSAAEVERVKTKATVVEVEVPPPTLDNVICRRETPTGTHQSRRVCRTRGQMTVERESAQEWLRSGGRRGGASVVPAVH